MKTCTICGKEFKPKNKVQKTCCFACQQQHKRNISLQWRREHPEAEKKYRLKQYMNMRKKDPEPVVEIHDSQGQVTIIKPLVAKEDDPKWVKDYIKSDRLDRISMLARALNNVCVDKPIFTYGNLSQIYGTEKYYKLEQDVIKRKRLAENE